MDQRNRGLCGCPGSRNGGERARDRSGEGRREDSGDTSPSRRVGSLNRRSDNFGGSGDNNNRGRVGSGGGNDNDGRRVGSGGGNDNHGRRVGSGSRHDDNSRRLRARVAVLVLVHAIANVDSRAAGDTDIDTCTGALVIA